MSKDIKKALEHCVEWNCADCPNRDELGSGEIVCRGRLLPEVLEYVTDLEAKLAEKDKEIERLKQYENFVLLQQIQASKENINKLLENTFQSPIAINVNQIAIEQLEKVKDYAQHIQGGLINYIDSQIKQLKEGK